MRFWDSSAVVPLLVQETATARLRALHRRDREMLVWWATPIECASALARVERQRPDAARAVETARTSLDRLARSWHEVQPVDEIRVLARRLLRVHPLRAADALQLAAALIAAEGRPASLEFVGLDERLAAAARCEGFPLPLR